MPEEKVHLVSFADGAFAPRKSVFQNMAQESCLFDSINVYDLNSLPDNFRATHAEYMMKTSRGFGYWIWKPVVILDKLKAADVGDCIAYMDAGFSINKGGKNRFREYLEMTRDSAYKMLSFSNIFTESHWTKMDCAAEIGISAKSSYMKTSQLGSGLIFLQKTSSNIELLETWSRIAIQDNYHFSDDSPSDLENHPNFREHRHDQSISSLLRKSRGTEATHYEVQAYQGRFEEMKENLPSWAARLRK